MAKMTIYILSAKTWGFAPQTPKTDENGENGGRHSSKTTVCQKHWFRHPGFWGFEFLLPRTSSLGWLVLPDKGLLKKRKGGVSKEGGRVPRTFLEGK